MVVPRVLARCLRLLSFRSPLSGQRPSEPIGFRPGLDDVRLVGEPVDHGFAQPRVGKHRRPFGKWQVRGDDYSRTQ